MSVRVIEKKNLMLVYKVYIDLFNTNVDFWSKHIKTTNIFFTILYHFSSSGFFEWKEKKVFPRLEEPMSPDMEAAPTDGKAFGFLCLCCLGVVALDLCWQTWHVLLRGQWVQD